MSALSDVLGSSRKHGEYACPFQEVHTIDYVNNPSVYSWATVTLVVRGEERVYLVLTNNMHVITVAERVRTPGGHLSWAEHSVTLPENLNLGRSNSLGIAAVAAMASEKTPGAVILSFIVKERWDSVDDDPHFGSPSTPAAVAAAAAASGNSGATWYFVSLKMTAEELAARPFHEALHWAKQTFKADLKFHTPFCLQHIGSGISNTFFLSGLDGSIHFFAETAADSAVARGGNAAAGGGGGSGSGGGIVGGDGNLGGGSGSGGGSVGGGGGDVAVASFLKDVQVKYTPEIVSVSKHAYTVSAIACMELPLSHCRISACGCTNGFLSVSVIDLADMRVVKYAEVMLDGPINSLEFYEHAPKKQQQQPPECLLAFSERVGIQLPSSSSSPSSSSPQHQQRVDLLVGGILGYAIWFANVQDGTLDESYDLPLPDGVDGVTCAKVVDNNLEGAPEVVVTTFSATALGFRLTFESPAAPPSFALRWAKCFEFPLLSLMTCNFSGGVLDDLLILGFRGCHVLQSTEMWERKDDVVAALDALREIGTMAV